MLKPFQYTSIALLCSMTVACSSGQGGQTSSPMQDQAVLSPPQDAVQPREFKVMFQELHSSSDMQHQSNMQAGDYTKYLNLFITRTNEGIHLNHSSEKRDRSSLKDKEATLGDDVGLRLLEIDDKLISQGFSVAHYFSHQNEASLLARDMEVNGWKYQSFGAFSSPKYGASAFVSFGEESKTVPVTGTATYSGIALGAVYNDGSGKPLAGLEEIASHLTISADFDRKTLQFNTTNTKGFKVDGAVAESKERVLDYHAWDLTGSATWKDSQKGFSGSVKLKSDASSTADRGSLQGSFFGPNAIEIGGTFYLKDQSKDYRGAFGGKQDTTVTQAQ
ncbi:MAG: transferrin-binding protein-like solute binding protein [Pasteurellaceae bacterium]|nr:transferrin-binding protein-like solute binding protein [Pasteurellaceae bacterium]